MKQGKTLMELASEVMERTDKKKDFVADTRQAKLSAYRGEDGKQSMEFEIKDQGIFGINNIAHGQIAGRLNIPKKYYDLMLVKAPQLLAENVNHWFDNVPQRRMIRTDGENVRAFLSNRYRVLDNDEILESVLPVISELQIQMLSCEVTDSKLYLKCLFPKIQGEVKAGDVVQSGIMISNSEVGLGAVRVMPLIYRLYCENGAISQDYGLRKYHVGRIAGKTGQEREAAFEVYKDDTLIADDRAFLMKLRDVVAASMDQIRFDETVLKLRSMTENGIEGDIIKSVEVVQKKFNLNENERTGVLAHLINGGDLSQYGMMNALTRTSQDVEDYDRATDLERMGGKVIELSPQDWESISMAKAA